MDHVIFAADDSHGFTSMCNSITSSGYDIQSDHSVAGWLKCQLGRTLKFGCFPVGPVFLGPKEFLISRIVSESRMLKEVEAQVEIAAEFVEYMNVVHKYLLVNLSNGIG